MKKKIFIFTGTVVALVALILCFLHIEKSRSIKIAEMEKEASLSKEELSYRDEMIVGLEDEIRKLKAEATDNKKASESLAEELESIKSDGGDYGAALDKLQGELDKANNQNAEYEDQIEKLESEIADYKESVAGYDDKISSYDDKISSYDEEIKGYTDKVTALEAELAQLQSLSSGKDTQIEALVAEVEVLREQSNKFKKVQWPDNTFNYLAIGNSITGHGLANYWWNAGCGMAASSKDKDYVNQISSYLKGVKGQTTTYKATFAEWEMLDTDRAETFFLIDGYLSDKIDLITIQLGENVHNTVTFAEDFSYLLAYIRKMAPKAQIIVIGDFWPEGNREETKLNVAASSGAGFVSLRAIQNNPAYQAVLGTILYDDNGNPHAVDHAGVAMHPNDVGMKYIAEAVCSVIK